MLIVEDDPDTANLVDLWVRDDPRCESVDTVGSGDAAFLAIAECDGAPDTIICDHNLGLRTSDEYLAGLKSAAPAARIIIHTEDPLTAAEDGVLELGADIVLDKDAGRLDELVDLALRPGRTAPATDC